MKFDCRSVGVAAGAVGDRLAGFIPKDSWSRPETHVTLRQREYRQAILRACSRQTSKPATIHVDDKTSPIRTSQTPRIPFEMAGTTAIKPITGVRSPGALQLAANHGSIANP